MVLPAGLGATHPVAKIANLNPKLHNATARMRTCRYFTLSGGGGGLCTLIYSVKLKNQIVTLTLLMAPIMENGEYLAIQDELNSVLKNYMWNIIPR